MRCGLEHGIGGPRQFSIAHGPFLRLLGRLHLTRADGTPRAWGLVAIACVPLYVDALLRVGLGDRPAPILFDLSVHTRLLIGIPLLIQADRILEQLCRGAIGQLYGGNFAERASLDRILDRAERLCGSRLVELAMFTLVVLGGQTLLWGSVGSTGLFAGISEAGTISFALLWYVIVAWPLVQFLFWRWLWHWLIWSYVLLRLSRLPLATIATHPDRAAGIGFLSDPIAGFSCFVLASAAVIASAWGTQILAGRASAQAFVPSFVVLLILAVVVACGPLLPFAGMLSRARSRERARFRGLALDYVRALHRKSVESSPDAEDLLDTSEMQSLNRLDGVYEGLVKVRAIPVGRREIAGICGAAVLPMLPLVATTVSTDELLRQLGRVLLAVLLP